MKFIYCAFCVLFLTACKQNIQQLTIEHPISFVEIDYSKMFGIANFAAYSQLFFLNGTDTTWSIKSSELPPNPKMVVLSSVFAGYVELLKKQNQIIITEQKQQLQNSNNIINKSVIHYKYKYYFLLK